jgi:hypothetical protein
MVWSDDPEDAYAAPSVIVNNLPQFNKRSQCQIQHNDIQARAR